MTNRMSIFHPVIVVAALVGMSVYWIGKKIVILGRMVSDQPAVPESDDPTNSQEDD